MLPGSTGRFYKGDFQVRTHYYYVHRLSIRSNATFIFGDAQKKKAPEKMPESPAVTFGTYPAPGMVLRLITANCSRMEGLTLPTYFTAVILLTLLYTPQTAAAVKKYYN